ncbi:MAG: hypothetical protein IKY45_02675 [Clostridia bacterium]|nr:hypothetical protein [Clostridia bacterium]
MSSNKLKIIACISMLIDHIGFLLFPQITVLRYIGRLAMPIFAYFIAEGCIHTRSKRKYFFTVLSLAGVCQAVYFAEDIMDGVLNTVNLNILFTFALSIVVCSAYLGIINNDHPFSRFLYTVLFTASLALSVFLCVFINRFSPVPISLDYGIAGVMLPLFAVVSTEKSKQLPLFFIGLIIFNLIISQNLAYSWYSLLSFPLLITYNGTRGTHRLKYFFYLFYPIHFAVIYVIKLVAV